MASSDPTSVAGMKNVHNNQAVDNHDLDRNQSHGTNAREESWHKLPIWLIQANTIAEPRHHRRMGTILTPALQK
jgi:hypothetical protein